MNIPDFGFGDFRVRQMCYSLTDLIKSDTSDIGPNIRPEIEREIVDLLNVVKALERTAERYLKEYR